MTIWLVTIGSSDVELQRQGQQDWRQQFQSLRTHNIERFSNTQGLGDLKEAQSGNINNRSVLMRILGDIYQDSSLIEDKALSNLDFPLLEQFISKLEELESEKVEDLKVFVLLTDQSTLFSPDEMRKSECPYWQDTVQLKPVLKWYLKHKLGSSVEPQFLVLQPRAESTEEGSRQKGIDCWNAMLGEVRENLNSANIEVQDKETVYVSHQAGTPAISSALQFCSIAKFGERVQFLVLNREYKDKKLTSTAKLLESSEYIRAIQIEKAKQLIDQGEPGAALALLDEKESKADDKLGSVINRLQDLVNLFNAKAIDNPNDDELDIKNAAARIKNTLDIVGLLFKNEKYVLGIAILESAHETFVKASVIYTWEKIKKESLHKFPISLGLGKNRKGKDITLKERIKLLSDDKLSWKAKGIMWTQQSNNETLTNRLEIYKIFKALECPKKITFWLVFQVVFKDTSNHQPEDKTIEQAQKIRNQFMHNLRGVIKEDVVSYLSGQSGKDCDDSILSIYKDKVVEPFHEALKKIGLWDAANLDDLPSIQDRLDDLIKDLDNLS